VPISSDPQLAARLIADAYALRPELEIAEVARGEMGRVWRLSNQDSTYAVKELFWLSPHDLSSGAAEAEVRKEVAFREAATVAGIDAPEDLLTVDGCYLQVLQAGLEHTTVRVATWAEGRPPTADTPGRATWIGHTLGCLQSLNMPPGESTVDSWWTTAPTTQRWLELADRAAVAGAPWADSLRGRIAHFGSLSAYVTGVDSAKLRLSHTDLQPQNVLVDACGRYTLLDWQVEPQDPADGLAAALVEWHVHDGVVHDDGIRTTLAAYRAAGGTAWLADLTAFGRNFGGYLNYVADQVVAALDDSQSIEHRTHANQMVANQVTGPPLGLTVYERILQLTWEN
jgi:Phosphotransferase enzyme family